MAPWRTAIAITASRMIGPRIPHQLPLKKTDSAEVEWIGVVVFAADSTNEASDSRAVTAIARPGMMLADRVRAAELAREVLSYSGPTTLPILCAIRRPRYGHSGGDPARRRTWARTGGPG